LLRDLAMLRALRRQPRHATLVATVWNPEATLAWMAGRSGQLWVMAHGNEVMPYPRGLKHVLRGWLRRRVLASARGVVCNSHYTQQLVRSICPAARTSVIPLGVDPARFCPATDKLAARRSLALPPADRIVLSVCRMDAYKGIDTILRAIAGLPLAHRRRMAYVVAGKGRDLPRVQALAVQLGIAENVRWLGYVDEKTLPSLYACVDLFVLCTREDKSARGVEGFGLVFLEAQASGVPVVGTRAGGIPDAIVEDQGGWLIGQDDEEALGRMLVRLIDDPGSFAEQGRLGRARVERECSWDEYVVRFAAAIGLTLPQGPFRAKAGQKED
jgi:phosphatidylinositol alpha-1,6-mannosyltransferase